MQPGATRPVGVTEEHLLGQKTAGFRRVAPGFFRGPIHDPEDEARRAAQAVDSGIPRAGQGTPECDWGCDSGVGMRSQAGAAQSAIRTV